MEQVMKDSTRQHIRHQDGQTRRQHRPTPEILALFGIAHCRIGQGQLAMVIVDETVASTIQYSCGFETVC